MNVFRSALVGLVLCACGFSQTSPTDPGAPAMIPSASQDSTRPQTQTPPDTKAPAPNPGQSAGAASNSVPITHSEPRYLTAGTDIHASLDTPLSTRTAKVGDRFTATINYPVHDSTGNVVIPVGSKLNGQISQPDDKIKDAIKDMGHLNLRFTDIQLPDGTDVPIDLTLISVHTGHPVTNTKNESPLAAGVVARNSPNATLGRPIKGLAVGNLAGGGYVLSTTTKRVELPAECVLRLRVDRNTLLP